MAGPDDTGLPAPQALDDPYASLSLPYASWWSPPPSSGPVPAAQPPPVDQTQAAPPPADMPAVAPPTPLAPPADLSQLGTAGPDGTVGGRPAVSQQLDASGKLIQPPTAGAEPVLPYGAITPDRAPADIAGPLSVGEAMNDQTRGVGQLAPAEKAPTPEEKWANDPLNPQATKDLTQEQQNKLMLDMATKDPTKYAGYVAQRNEIARQDALKRESEESLANAQRAQNEFSDYQKAQAETQAEHQKMLADAEALAKEKVDPEHWKKTRSPLQLLAAGLSLVAGAIHQGTGGKTNPGLDIINKAIDDDNKAQSENLASRRAVLGMKLTDNRDQRAQNQQDFQMLTSRRIAMHQQVIDAIQTDLQNYDPHGSIAQQYTGAIVQQKAAQTTAANAFYQQTLKNKLDISKDDRETYTAQQTAKHQQDEIALARQKEAREAATAADAKGKDVVYSPDALKQMYPGLPENLYPTAPTKLSQFDKVVETHAKVQTAGKAATDAAAENYAVGGVQLKSGDQLQIKDTGERGKVVKMVAGADQVNKIANRLAREITEWGGQSDIKKSPHYQEITSDYQDLIFALHEAKDIEGFRPGVAEMLHPLTGDVDPNSFIRTATPGILRARDNINDDVSTKLSRINKDAVYVPPADTSKTAEPQKTVVDDLGTEAQDEVRSGPGGGLGGIAPKFNPDGSVQAPPSRVPKLDALYEIASGTSTDPLYKSLAADPNERAKALGYIRDMATKGEHDVSRDRAQQMLDLLNQGEGPTGASFGSSDAAGNAATGTVRITPDEVIGSKKKAKK